MKIIAATAKVLANNYSCMLICWGSGFPGVQAKVSIYVNPHFVSLSIKE